ncbi:MAG: hypothetical protein WC380_00045 [Pedobacter sp.]|jgi:hypothetical protein
MKIKEAMIHDLIRQCTLGKITFSRMAEIINEKAVETENSEQSRINLNVMIRQCCDSRDGKNLIFSEQRLCEYFDKSLQKKDYTEYDTI